MDTKPVPAFAAKYAVASDIGQPLDDLLELRKDPCPRCQKHSGMRNPPVGHVADLVHETSATVQFLAGRKLSRTDIQTVDKRFVITKVTVEHDIDKEEIIVPQSS